MMLTVQSLMVHLSKPKLWHTVGSITVAVQHHKYGIDVNYLWFQTTPNRYKCLDIRP